MKTILRNTLFIGMGAMGMLSCDPKIEAPTPTGDGKIDMTRYVAIGNSLTAGFASNGLYLEGQKVAYPVLIAQQFKQAGGGEFNAPLFSADQADGTGYLKLTGFFNPTTPILTQVPQSPQIIGGVDPRAIDVSLNQQGVFFKPFDGTRVDNWGVPGIRIIDVDTLPYGWKNPYFGRLLKTEEKGVVSYQQKIYEQKPTFFTCWLGNNDILGFSTSGGVEVLAPPTLPNVFAAKYTAFLNGLMAASPGAKGVLANIPDVTSIPFFTTVGPSLKTALPATGIFELDFSQAFLLKMIAVLSGSMPKPIVAPTDPKNISPASLAVIDPITKVSSGDVFIPLTFSSHAPFLGKPYGKAWNSVITALVGANLQTLKLTVPSFANSTIPQIVDSVWAYSGLDSTKPFGVHPQNPLPDNLVLNATESATAKSLVAAYNATIEGLATSKGLAFVDANKVLGEITKGAYYDGISTSSAFLSGGAFSLDGVHLTPRGNAMAANEFIKAINKKYSTKISVLNVGQYRGVTFP